MRSPSLPSEEPIGNVIGHGALGLRDNMRPVSELFGETSAQRHFYVELRPGYDLTMGGFTDEGAGGAGGHYYSATVNQTWDGKLLDVVGVRVSTQAPLVRVESEATCAATLGTFYFEEATTTLFLYLSNGGNPGVLTVVAQLGFYFSTRGVVQPALGPNKLTDGGLEVWTSATNLTSWTEQAFGDYANATVNRDSSVRKVGTYAARIEGQLGKDFAGPPLGVKAGGYGIASAVMEAVAGGLYRASGYYRTSATNPADIHARIRVGVSGAYMTSDGLATEAAAVGFALTDTAGEWRRFAFDFRYPTATANLELSAFAYTAATGAQTCAGVWFDALELRRIHRWEYQEPRLDGARMPTIETARADAFFGPVSVGIGRLAIPNGGTTRLEALFGTYDWLGADAIFRVGGRFPGVADEILFDECPIVATAKLGSPVVSDAAVQMDLEDGRKIRFRTLPVSTYTLEEYPDLAAKETGRPKPLPFGAPFNARPAMVDLETNGCGTYSLGENAYAGFLPGFGNPSEGLIAYEDEEAASKADLPRALLIRTAAGDWTNSSPTDGFHIDREVRPRIIDSSNDTIDFDIGGAALVARIAHGRYVPGNKATPCSGNYLADSVGTAMSVAAGVTITVVLTASSNKITISKAAGTLNLLCSTGANRDTSAWAILGFNTNADKTAALSYTADDAMFDTPDRHCLRAHRTTVMGALQSVSMMDDASGTYTGGASTPIRRPPDVVLFILRQILAEPASAVDSASFVAARSWVDPDTVNAYVGGCEGRIAFSEFLSRIEATCAAEITLEGGIWYFRARDTSVPADVVDVFDYDILDFASWYDPRDLFATVRVEYDENASTGEWKVEEDTDSSIAARFDRADPIIFRTYCPDNAHALTRLSALATEAKTKRRRCALAVMGKCLQLVVGSKFRVTRTKGLGSSGTWSAVLVRILSVTHDWSSWRSTIEAIEVV